MESDRSNLSEDCSDRLRGLVRAAQVQVAGATREFSTADTSLQSRVAPERTLEKESLQVRIPGYEIYGEYHRGGQGVIYKAMQRSTQRTVAIKVMRAGPFARATDRTRFEREIQILAGLSHPNIVAIHDSGCIAGHDYFVMDFVEGAPLDRYVRMRTPTGIAPLLPTVELFVKVCEGLNAAHLRGVIHRDLKPGNVLVDSQGQPRILDFGLAKQTEAEMKNSASLMTETGQFIGSLPWSSPEQAQGQATDIRTDVYSLGVMLYHALTGSFPYSVDGSPGDVLAAIRDQAPRRPRTLRGDIDDELETIAMKCLAKEPERRYQIGGDVGKDLHRYLTGEPIEAKRESSIYMLRKTLRRYRLAVFAGATLLALSALFSTVVAVQSGRISRERDRAANQYRRAERVQAFLQSIFAGAAPTEIPASEVSARMLLDDGARRVDEEFADWPEEAASIHETLGDAYDRLGLYPEAESHYQRSCELRKKIFGIEHILTARSLARFALCTFHKQDLPEAEILLRQALDQHTRLVGATHPETIYLSVELAALLSQQQRFEEAEALARRAVDLRRGEPISERMGAGYALSVLGLSLKGRGRYREALVVMEEAAELVEHEEAGSHVHEPVLMGLSEIHEKLGDIDEAERLLRQVVELRRARLGDEHPALAWNLLCLGRFLLEHRENAVDAEPLVRKALAIQTARKGPDHIDTADCESMLARVIMASGRFAEAESLLRDSLRIRRQLPPAVRGEVQEALAYLADCLEAQARFQEANEIRGQMQNP